MGYSALNGYARYSSGVSNEAGALMEAAGAVVQAAEDSQSLFGEKAAALSLLQRLAADCADQGWDGADACPIDRTALRNSKDFVRALPDSFPLPECAAEPDGSISLDWIQTSHRIFSLSVGPSSRLAYAWLDGADCGHGVESFDGVSIPPRILFAIKAVIGYEHSRLRAA